MISQKVMKTHEFNDSIYYRAACSCGSDEHDVTIEFEKDEGIPSMIFLNFHKKIAWCSHWGDNLNIFERAWKRIKCSFLMLFTGYVELEESFILQEEENIDGFIEALIEGKESIKRKIDNG